MLKMNPADIFLNVYYYSKVLVHYTLVPCKTIHCNGENNYAKSYNYRCKKDISFLNFKIQKERFCMKKTRFLVLVLAVAVMLVGAAYAYWTQDLTINTTVNTGELEVIFQEPANVTEEDDYQINADCTPDGYSMEVTFNDVYPGVRNNFYFDMVNTGTLGAYVDDFSITAPSHLTDNKVIRIDYIGVKEDGDEFETYYEGKSIPLANALKKLNEGNGIFVEAGEENKVTVEMGIVFNPGATEKEMAEEKEYKFQVKAKVYQFNARPTTAPTTAE